MTSRTEILRLIKAMETEFTIGESRIAKEIVNYGEEAIQYLVGALKSKNPHVLCGCMEALAELGKTYDISRAEKPLSKLVFDNRIGIQIRAIKLLGEIGSKTMIPYAVATLVQLLHIQDIQWFSREKDAKQHYRNPPEWGPAFKEAINALVKMSQVNDVSDAVIFFLIWDREIEGKTAEALLGMGRWTVDILLERIHGTDQKLRKKAAKQLDELLNDLHLGWHPHEVGLLGVTMDPITRFMIDQIRNGNALHLEKIIMEPGADAVLHLEDIESEPLLTILPKLLKIFSEGDEGTRKRALKAIEIAIAAISYDKQEEHLELLAEDKDLGIRLAFIRGLGRTLAERENLSAKITRPLLFDLLYDPQPEIRAAVLKVIENSSLKPILVFKEELLDRTSKGLEELLGTVQFLMLGLQTPAQLELLRIKFLEKNPKPREMRRFESWLKPLEHETTKRIIEQMEICAVEEMSHARLVKLFSDYLELADPEERNFAKRRCTAFYAAWNKEIRRKKGIVNLGDGVLSEGTPKPPTRETHRTGARRQFA